MDHLPLSSSSGLSRRTLIKSTAATALAATPFISARAQAPARITVAYPSRSGASWAIWLAKQAGLYEKHGLDVKLEYGVHPVGVAMLAIAPLITRLMHLGTLADDNPGDDLLGQDELGEPQAAGMKPQADPRP